MNDGVTLDVTQPFPEGLVAGALVKHPQMGLGKIQSASETADTLTVQFVFFYPGIVMYQYAVTPLTPDEVNELYSLVMERTTDPEAVAPTRPCFAPKPVDGK